MRVCVCARARALEGQKDEEGQRIVGEGNRGFRSEDGGGRRQHIHKHSKLRSPCFPHNKYDIEHTLVTPHLRVLRDVYEL